MIKNPMLITLPVLPADLVPMCHSLVSVHFRGEEGGGGFACISQGEGGGGFGLLVGGGVMVLAGGGCRQRGVF